MSNERFDDHLPEYKANRPQETFLVADVCFFGKAQGVLVIRSPEMKQNLWWTDIEKALVSDCELGIFELRMEGLTMKGITMGSQVSFALQYEYSCANVSLPSDPNCFALYHQKPKTPCCSRAYVTDPFASPNRERKLCVLA